MVLILTLLGALLMLAGAGFYIFVVVEAFRDELWKGLLCLFGCGLYFVYYAFVDFDHEYKWWILLGCFGCPLLSSGVLALIPHS